MRPRTSSSWASACSWVIFSFLTKRASWPCVTSRALCSPTSTNFWSTSLRTTGMSAAAIAWAISPPIVPAPTTAALKMNMLGFGPLLWLGEAQDPSRHLVGLRLGGVLRPRPEEAAQPVLAPPRDDVDVQVRDRLRDDVVDRVEDAVGLHRIADGDAQALGGLRERAEQLGRGVEQRDDVLARHQERVAVEQRAVVEEGDEALVLVDDVGRNLAGHDAAERAAHVRSRSAASSI